MTSQRNGIGGTTREHNSALDGVRGLAVLLVILHHVAEIFPNQNRPFDPILGAITVGWIGVDLFFVLSGFLITDILIRTKTADNRAKIFYARRALRILPIYYLMLLLTIPLAKGSAWARSMLPWNTPGDFAALCLYFQNWIPFWNGGQFSANIVGHFWSLGVEENFYMLWPWLIWFVPNRWHSRMCVLGICLSLSIRVGAIATLGWAAFPYLMTARGFDGLLVGSALAIENIRRSLIPKWLLAIMLAAGTGIIVAIALVHSPEILRPGRLVHTVGVFGYTLIFGALVGSSLYPKLLITRVMSFPWLRAIGTYSYGMYVYHVPLFQLEHHFLFERGLRLNGTVKHELLFMLFVLCSTYLVAWASFRVIEQPILRLKRRYRPHYAAAPQTAVPV